jgi:uncharacterized membrane protein YgcG
MTDRLYDALEICLQKLEQGQAIDSALKLYPDLESELRPILEASLQARTLADAAVPSAAQQRGRVRLIKRAAELRKAKRTSPRRMTSFIPRMALAFGLAAALILSSTGLVGASSNSLPGDQLYPVKRTWEGVQLAFMFNQQARETLQSQFDQERLNEIDDLLSQNRSEPVAFSGLVISSQDGMWLVSGIPVRVTDKTRLTSSRILDSLPVIVTGATRPDGVLEAEEIQPLQPGSMLPPLEPNNPNANPKVPASVLPLQTSAAPLATPQSFGFIGVVQGKQGSDWTINGQSVSVDQADVNGQISIGDAVKFDGYYSDNGNFVVTKIESDAQGAPSRPNGGSNPGGHDNGNGNGGGKGGGGDSGGGGD